MTLTCPRCRRTLAEAATSAEAPLFCMYCGQKLRIATGLAENSPAVDDPTQAYAPTPPEAEDTATQGPGGLIDAAAEPQPSGVGGFRLVRLIGAGGMGSVYEAEHDETGHRVAIKLLSGRLASNPVSVERFRQEGRVASQISHPHCVFVLAADTDAGRPYIVMELMPGRTLKDVVDRRGPLPVGEAVARILDVIDGLAEAHRLGVIHRDVKPSNCFLTNDDRVKIGDFGLSKSLASDPGGRQITQSGAFLGTVLFASPEQIRGESVSYESDVYAVCGTLYYLLTGRAPYQHESLTASLAKAVSEAPPPIRVRRPEVSAELERIVLRGLDRDRDRRWQSLEDLRDALSEQQPERQQPARPRALVMAYLTDSLLLGATLLLFGVIRDLAFNLPDDPRERWLMVGWIDFILTVAYFGFFEGLFGWSPGKRLLRLRVARVGQAGPPGFGRAALRALVFNAIWYLTFIVPQWLFGVRPVGPVLAMTAAICGLLLLLRQFWKSADGWRGIHDFASGCRVIQRPRPTYRLRLVSQQPDPLSRIQPTTVALPASVGGFGVMGKLTDLADGGEIWIGADRSLGRQVLIRILPPGQTDPIEDDTPITRPTRLRLVGHGTLDWNGSDRGWIAYVAPAGAPLVDVVGSSRRLNWAEARPVLEQLAAEFVAAETDRTGVDHPTIDQVWVEPGGRVQLLDFPLPSGRLALSEPAGRPDRPRDRTRPGSSSWSPGPPSSDPLNFLRQAASLALEGRPRSGGGRIEAPLPPHASRITDHLFASGYKSVSQLKADLADNHAHPPQVTSSLRAAHLGAQGTMLAVGLAFMFLMSGLYTWSLAYITAESAASAQRVRNGLNDPTARESLLNRAHAEATGRPSARRTAEHLDAALAPDQLPNTLAKLDRWVESRRADVEDRKRFLTRPEQIMLSQSIQLNESNITESRDLMPSVANAFIQLSREGERDLSPQASGGLIFGIIVIVLFFPLLWMAFSFVLRGGASMRLAGLTLVRSDGRLADRFRCALRDVIVWTPVVALLFLTLWVQAIIPERVILRTTVWLLGLLLLPIYVMLALRDPPRPPHDRILGLHIVPA